MRRASAYEILKIIKEYKNRVNTHPNMFVSILFLKLINSTVMSRRIISLEMFLHDLLYLHVSLPSNCNHNRINYLLSSKQIEIKANDISNSPNLKISWKRRQNMYKHNNKIVRTQIKATKV